MEREGSGGPARGGGAQPRKQSRRPPQRSLSLCSLSLLVPLTDASMSSFTRKKGSEEETMAGGGRQRASVFFF
jgi:hypothetical protein